MLIYGQIEQVKKISFFKIAHTDKTKLNIIKKLKLFFVFKLFEGITKSPFYEGGSLAPPVGFEPTTTRLTAEGSSVRCSYIPKITFIVVYFFIYKPSQNC